MLSMVTVWAAEGGHESASPWIPYAVGGATTGRDNTNDDNDNPE